MTQAGEKRIINLLEKLVAKQQAALEYFAKKEGKPLPPENPEEHQKYLEYVRKRLYG